MFNRILKCCEYCFYNVKSFKLYFILKLGILNLCAASLPVEFILANKENQSFSEFSLFRKKEEKSKKDGNRVQFPGGASSIISFTA